MIESLIKPNVYCDSLVLMRLSSDLAKREGIGRAVVMMGTDENKKTIRDQDLITDELKQASPNDLVVVVKAETKDQVKDAIAYCLQRLEQGIATPTTGTLTYRTLDAAIRNSPEANLVAISLPGKYADREARRALKAGLHIFLFSDHVPLEKEIQLKRLASEKRLLMMGPDCGTAILCGKGLGFSNSVHQGPVGIVGASGTGTQEISTIISRLGSGISQVIGTGSRDVSDEVGGIALLAGIEWLAQDTETHVIVIVTKPPGEPIVKRVLDLASKWRKPFIVNLLGFGDRGFSHENIFYAETLEESALFAVALTSGKKSHDLRAILYHENKIRDLAKKEHDQFDSEQKYFRGLFSGGTYANESALLLSKSFKNIHGNISLPGVTPLDDPWRSFSHTCVDLGEDLFTIGKPHPILDNTIRCERLLSEAADPATGVILLDLVLGHGAHPDPASDIGDSIKMAKEIAVKDGRHLAIIVNVCGVDQDPQGCALQIEKIRKSGALVAPTNASGTRLAIGILKGDVPGLNLSFTPRAIADQSAYVQPDKLPFHLPDQLSVINIGLLEFFESLKAQETPVIHVDFHPPAGGDEKLATLLSEML